MPTQRMWGEREATWRHVWVSHAMGRLVRGEPVSCEKRARKLSQGFWVKLGFCFARFTDS